MNVQNRLIAAGDAPPAQSAARWSLRDPQTRAAATTLFWVYAATFCVLVASLALRGRGDPRFILGLAVPMMPVDAALDVPLFVALRLTAGSPGWRRWPLMVALMLTTVTLQSCWDTQLRAWVGLLQLDFGNPGFYNGVIRAMPVNIYHSGLLVALFTVEQAYFRLRDSQQALLASRAAERSAHLIALRLQLNPHFLFNSMNALSSLVVTRRVDDAEAMIGRLSGFMRATLSSDPASLVRLDEEFETLETYLSIERVRFGDRLETKISLPVEAAGLRIPPFLLQPLVENAVKYGVAPGRRPVCVSLDARIEDEGLLLTVADTGTGCEGVSGGTGLGLANIRERLTLEYGRGATLSCDCTPAGYTAVICIPLAALVGER